MRLRITRPASAQIAKVLAYIDQHNPQGAHRVRTRLQSLMQMLTDHPLAGPMTARRDIRRVIALPYPYAITYTVRDDEIVILGVRHVARKPLV